MFIEGSHTTKNTASGSNISRQRLVPTQVEEPLTEVHSKYRLPGLSANRDEVANTLAYFDVVTINVVKRFIGQAPGSCTQKLLRNTFLTLIS